jgi:anti-anti-sigma regulatory factor
MIERPVGDMGLGDHATFTFTSAGQQAHVIGPFLCDGLDAREKVIYISRARPWQLPGLHRRPDTDQYVGSGQLRVIPQESACLRWGRFDPDRMRTVISDEIAMNGEQGYRAVRVTADLSWVLNDPDGLPRILECEAGFDEAIECGAAIMAICQLDRNRCSADQLAVLTGAHPIRVTANPEYDDGVLRILRRHEPDGLRLIGELDAARHEPFLAALTPLTETNTDTHLDFAHVRFLDLGALTLLVRHAMEAPPGHVLILDDLPPDVADIIQTLGWHNLHGITRGRSRPL